LDTTRNQSGTAGGAAIGTQQITRLVQVTYDKDSHQVRAAPGAPTFAKSDAIAKLGDDWQITMPVARLALPQDLQDQGFTHLVWSQGFGYGLATLQEGNTT
jgi:hypothetical protein